MPGVVPEKNVVGFDQGQNISKEDNFVQHILSFKPGLDPGHFSRYNCVSPCCTVNGSNFQGRPVQRKSEIPEIFLPNLKCNLWAEHPGSDTAQSVDWS